MDLRAARTVGTTGGRSFEHAPPARDPSGVPFGMTVSVAGRKRANRRCASDSCGLRGPPRRHRYLRDAGFDGARADKRASPGPPAPGEAGETSLAPTLA